MYYICSVIRNNQSHKIALKRRYNREITAFY